MVTIETDERDEWGFGKATYRLGQATAWTEQRRGWPRSVSWRTAGTHREYESDEQQRLVEYLLGRPR